MLITSRSELTDRPAALNRVNSSRPQGVASPRRDRGLAFRATQSGSPEDHRHEHSPRDSSEGTALADCPDTWLGDDSAVDQDVRN